MCGRYSLGVPVRVLFLFLRATSDLTPCSMKTSRTCMATTCMLANGSGATSSSRGAYMLLDIMLIRVDDSRHNIAPRSQAPVLRRREPAEDASPDDLVLQTMRWGLVPHWSKHEDKTLNTTNARREHLVEGGGMWQSIKGKRRCAVLCEGSVHFTNVCIMVVALAHNIFVRFSLDISARYAKYASSRCRAPSWAALTERTTTSRDARGVSRGASQRARHKRCRARMRQPLTALSARRQMH